jgi:hypothetical protein
MAAINISSPGLNPTNNFLPIKSNNEFADSMLCQQSTNVLTSIDVNTKNTNGISIDNSISRYIFGDFDGNVHGQNLDIKETDSVSLKVKKYFTLSIDDLSPEIRIDAAVTALSAGIASGKYLSLRINGTIYKLSLLNNTI